MGKWSFIKQLIKEANQVDEALKTVNPRILANEGPHPSKNLLRRTFKDARSDPNEMDLLRSRFDPNYKDYIGHEGFNTNLDVGDYSLEDVLLDRDVTQTLNGLNDISFEYSPDIEELITYRNLRDNKNYLKPEVVQKYYDNGYRDFINEIRRRISKGEDPKEAARKYLYEKHFGN